MRGAFGVGGAGRPGGLCPPGPPAREQVPWTPLTASPGRGARLGAGKHSVAPPFPAKPTDGFQGPCPWRGSRGQRPWPSLPTRPESPTHDPSPRPRRPGRLGRVPAGQAAAGVCRAGAACGARRCAHGAVGGCAGVCDAGGGGPAVSGVGLPAVRPGIAQSGAGLGADRHPGASAGGAHSSACAADDGERAGAARAAAGDVPGRQPRCVRRARRPSRRCWRHFWRRTATAGPAR